MSAPAFLVVVIATLGSAPRFACVRGGSSGSSDFLTAVITSNGEVETEHDVQTPLLNSSHTLKSGEGEARKSSGGLRRGGTLRLVQPLAANDPRVLRRLAGLSCRPARRPARPSMPIALLEHSAKVGRHLGKVRSELSSVTKQEADEYLAGVREWLDKHGFKYEEEIFIQDDGVEVSFPVPLPADITRLRQLYNLQVQLLVSGIPSSEIHEQAVNIDEETFLNYAPSKVGMTAPQVTPAVLLRNADSLKGPFKDFVLAASAGAEGEPKVDELVKSAKSLHARLMRIHAKKTAGYFTKYLLEEEHDEDPGFFLQGLEFLVHRLPCPEGYPTASYQTLLRTEEKDLMINADWLLEDKLLLEYIVFLLHVIVDVEPINLLMQVMQKFPKMYIDIDQDILCVAFFFQSSLFEVLRLTWEEEMASVPDALRASIIVKHPSQLGTMLESVYKTLQVRNWACVVNNQWLAPRFNGYADIRLNILVFDRDRQGVDGQKLLLLKNNLGERFAIYEFSLKSRYKVRKGKVIESSGKIEAGEKYVSIAELQIHLECIVEAKQVQHLAYEYGRSGKVTYAVVDSTERASLAIYTAALARSIGT